VFNVLLHIVQNVDAFGANLAHAPEI